MSDKIIYEIGLVGADSVLSNVEKIENAITNISGDGFDRLNKKVDSTVASLLGLVGVTKQLKTLQTPFTRRGTNAAIDQGLIPNFNLKDIDLTHFAKTLDEFKKFKQRISDFNRNILESIFKPSERALLGYIPSGGSDMYYRNTNNPFGYGYYKTLFPDAEIIAGRTSDRTKRHSEAEELRAKFRKKYGKRNPWRTPETEQEIYPIVPVGNVNTDYIDQGFRENRLWRYRPTFSEWFNWSRRQSNDPRGFFENMRRGNGMASTIGKIGTFGFGLLSIISKFNKFRESIEKVIKGLKNFGDEVLQAKNAWQLMRESYAYGTSTGSLSGQWNAIRALGGDAASASALWGRLSSERAMLGYGGTGGSMMEAARLFGVNIRGSGAFGYATNDELMHNVAKAMERLSPSGKRALADTLKLDDRMFWLVSHGQRYYQYRTQEDITARTLIGMGKEWTGMVGPGEGRLIYSRELQEDAMQWDKATSMLTNSFKELGGVLGEVLLPILNVFTKALSILVQVISWVLKGIKTLFQPFIDLLRWVDSGFGLESETMQSTPSANEMQARIAQVNNQYSNASNRTVTINVGGVSLNTLGLDENATEDQVNKKVLQMFNNLGEELTDGRR